MNWIDIKEQLPEFDKDGKSERVLVYLGHDTFFIVYFVEEKYRWGNVIRAYQGNYPFSDTLFSLITHWAKLTPPQTK